MSGHAASSLARRLAFGSAASYLADRLASQPPFRPLAVVGDWPLLRIPVHAARLAFDAIECLRTARRVPSFGNAEQALGEAAEPLPQPPRYRAYFYDGAEHAMVGLHVGVDLIPSGGRYFVIENNIGPSIYGRRRTLYETPFDPLVTQIAATARAHAFEKVVFAAFRWSRPYLAELGRAAGELGLPFAAATCPLPQPEGAPSLVALPRRLAAKTLYVIHAGLTAPAVSYVDNKWHSHCWLAHALENELPADSPVALPRTRTELAGPLDPASPRWPNLVVKLADSARSRHVIAARFDDEREARAALGLAGPFSVPRGLRGGFARSLLLGRDRVLYQQFVPPELDTRGHARMIRLHLLVTPLAASFVSAHYRISKSPVPERVPRGVIRLDDAYVFNQADYQRIPPETEAELRVVAAHIGSAMQRALARKFVTGCPS